APFLLPACDPNLSIGDYPDDDTSDDDLVDDDSETDDDSADDDDTTEPALAIQLSLNQNSPSGTFESGWTNALIVDITTNKPVTLQFLPLTVHAEDNAENGWSDFSQLANPAYYRLWEVELAEFVELDCGWFFGHFDDLSFGYLLADTDYILSSGTHSLELRMVTEGAGTGLEPDTLSIDIDLAGLLVFKDEHGQIYNGDHHCVTGLPIIGLDLELVAP
ncbi:MAG: hypothetical protein V1695_02825, partial [Candidatus Uhrbacteria bacterium]